MIKRFVRTKKKGLDIQRISQEAYVSPLTDRERKLLAKVQISINKFSFESREKPLFFIHIPKTAGTSFRKAAEDYFGFQNVCYDYSASSEETSLLVKKHIYPNEDYLGLQAGLSEFGICFLSGHVPVNKYVYLLGLRQSITFCREPIQRVISEYNHFVRHNDYEGDLPSFYRKPQFINRQSKMLQGIPLEALGFIGLTEDYEVGLSQLNSFYGMAIESRALNKGRRETDKTYQLPVEQLQEMELLNSQDITLYQRVVVLYHQRLKLSVQGLPYVHGAIQEVTSKGVRGWAWYAQGEKAVQVEILAEGLKLATLEANELRPGLLHLSPPRQGYVGFRYNFTKPLGAGVTVSVRVAETEQILGQQEVVVA
ncbi:sulfotransferase family 2 domain-containing protein [Marinobacterium lutimaris]|uniref:Sulfotransferase family protein n=1 Tax=Marinobacterium lutimaris TaxID=568106 RepID=A0A1H6B3H7_9GAMM|nr:sulfotransferase family 2 domain-containing protein [Marinobacterium lutimaris]SEG54935.1 Sulfotransferase family protein [Marinobacterium lutimaris]